MVSSALPVYLYASAMQYPISMRKEWPPGIEINTNRPIAIRFIAHAIAGSAVVLMAAYLGVRLHVNFSATGFLDLLVVVLVAMLSGFWEATVTSIAALTCLNYFFVEPVYTFYVADPQNWVALIAFESSALLVSRLSLQKEKQARTAIQERRGMEKLYEFSRRTLLMNPQQSPGRANCVSDSGCRPSGGRGVVRCRARAHLDSAVPPARNWKPPYEIPTCKIAIRTTPKRALGGGCFVQERMLPARSCCAARN